MSDVFRVYKEIGETPLEALERLRKEKGIPLDVPMTYAGRLDPMAEGLLLILAGEECKMKDEYLALDKTYEFSILLGVSTDTGDLLGIPKSTVNSRDVALEDFNLPEKVKDVFQSFVGRQSWEYPAYSSRTVEGKPLWWWKRENKINEIEIPKTKIKINSINFFKIKNISSRELFKLVSSRIEKVKGDFRQEEILRAWRKMLSQKQMFQLIEGEINCSTATYIRTFAEKLGRELHSDGTLFGLKRITIGNFILEK